MNRGKTTTGKIHDLRIWTGLSVLALMLIVIACSAPSTPELTSTPAVSMPTPTPTATPLPILPTLAPLPPLPTILSQPAIVPTPLPDEQEVVDVILGSRSAEHWVAHRVGGSFTAPDADEWLALVGNIGDLDEVRWVVIGRMDDDWQLRATSEILSTGFGDVPPHYFPPDLLDFDDDDQQEALIHYFKMQQGWLTSSDTLYRWDGHALASVWGAPTIVDNRTADSADVPQPYRENYQAEWEWVDLDDDDLDEILLRERVAFYLPDEEGHVKEDAPIIGEESGERAFRWDGEAFHPYAPDGPTGTFAYAAWGDLWLWQDRSARPLDVGHVREFHWSPDGQRVAWWAQSLLEDTSRGTILGIYNLATGVRREFSIEGAPSTLGWVPDGRLAYALPGLPLTLLDPETGQRQPLPVVALGTWSPDGDRIAYEQGGNLYLYDLSTGQEQPLVIAPEGTGTVPPTVLPHPAWSPRGDWIACTLAKQDLTWVGLVSPDLSEPLSGPDLLEPFGGREAPALQFAWSAAGSHLAALTADPRSGERPTVLYIAEVPPGGSDPVGRPDWREVLQLETLSQTIGLAWSPGGERVTLAAGQEVWEVTTLRQAQGTASEETTLRYRFSVPELAWTTLEWAPDGSGFLVGLESVGYEGHLYWFPADSTEPVLLLASSLSVAHWSSRIVEAQAQLAMVLVEYTDTEPLLHFVDEDGSDVVVPAEGADRHTEFQIGGQYVYYEGHYAGRDGGVPLPTPDAPGHLHSLRVTSDGSRLAWLFVDDQIDVGSRTGKADFRLVVTDRQGNDPREVWHRVETPSNFRWSKLLGWRADGGEVYLSQRRYIEAATYFELNPGILAVDVATGEVTQVGDLEGVTDAAVSADGVWLVQAETVLGPAGSLTVTLCALIDKAKIHIPGAEGALLAGDFSFAPDSGWLSWREWGSMPDGSKLLIRAMHLPEGEPFTVYEEPSDYAPTVIGGWMGRDDLVLVQENGTGPSTVVTLPSTGLGSPLSPFVFLGVWPGD